MEAATGLGLPWRMLRDKLVAVDPDTQLVKYSTTFDKLSDDNKSVSSLFRNNYFTCRFSSLRHQLIGNLIALCLLVILI